MNERKSCLHPQEDHVVRAREPFSGRGGAGEPLGETAPPPGILDRVPDEIRKPLPDEVVDELLAGARTEEEIVGPGGLLAQLTQRLVERALEVELTDHVGYERHQEPPGGTGNTRNGSTPKTLQTEHGPVQISTPRDRDGSFEPKLVRKRQRRFEGFDEKDPGALRARDVHPRYRGAPARALWRRVGRDLISGSPTRSWTTSARGSTPVGGRLSRGVPGLPGAQDPRRRQRCSARRATWRWRSGWTAPARCSGCGFKTPRARSSGCRSSTSCATAASETS